LKEIGKRFAENEKKWAKGKGVALQELVFNQFFRSGLEIWTRIQAGYIQWPTSEEISCFEVLDVLFGGLEASFVAWNSFSEASE
jgi:hypothetical protein